MVTASTLVRTQAGDQEAFRELTDPYRAELPRQPLRHELTKRRGERRVGTRSSQGRSS